jgi:ABC-type uncharacterized transport system ATPase subunit
VSGIETIDGVVELKTAKASQVVIDLVRLIESQDNQIIDLQIRRPSLEDVFIELTGSRLRE